MDEQVQDEYYIEPKLKEQLDLYRHMVKNKNFSIMICIDGKPRRGKSTLAIQIGKYLDPTIAQSLDRICFTTDDFKKAVDKYSNGEKGKVIILDEAINMFASGESNTAIGRKLNKLLMMCGLFNQIYILCLPSIFDLNPYIRRQQIDILIRMELNPEFDEITKKVKELNRGYWYFYGNEAKDFMLTFAKAKYDYSKGRYDFRGRNYGKVDMETVFGSAYEKKKRETIEQITNPKDEPNDTQNIIKRLHESRGKVVNNNLICYVCKISEKTIYNNLKRIENNKDCNTVNDIIHSVAKPEQENFITVKDTSSITLNEDKLGDVDDV